METAGESKAEIAYRKKNFAIEVEKSRHPDIPGEFILRVTTNGRQWHSLGFTADEWAKVAKAVKAYLKGGA